MKVHVPTDREMKLAARYARFAALAGHKQAEALLAKGYVENTLDFGFRCTYYQKKATAEGWLHVAKEYGLTNKPFRKALERHSLA